MSDDHDRLPWANPRHDVTITVKLTFRTGQLNDDQAQFEEWRRQFSELAERARRQGPGAVRFALGYQVERVDP